MARTVPTTESERSATALDSPSDVTHLVLGGGGAGALANFGALAALADLGYFTRVEIHNRRGKPTVDYFLPDRTAGVAGTSTSGIIATLLAMGVGLRMAFDIVVPDRGPDGLPDPMELALAPEEWTRRHRPTFSGIDTTSVENPNRELWGATGGHTSPLTWLAGHTDVMDESELTRALNEAGRGLAMVMDGIDDHGIPAELVEPVLASGDLATYVHNLVTDYGLFSGRKLRAEFGHEDSPLYDAERGASPADVDEVSWEQDVAVDGEQDTGTMMTPRDLGNLSFARFAAFVEWERPGPRTELALTGTDLTRRRGQVFSATETPRIPIADALRTTIAMPPILVPTVGSDDTLDGLWVDGSLTNAFPLHAFDEGGTLPDGVLGFNLRWHTERSVESSVDLAAAVAARFAAVSATGRIRSERERAHTVDIPGGSLPYLTLPNTDALVPVLTRSAAAVYRYFGREDPERRAATAVDKVLLQSVPDGGATQSAGVE